MYSCIQCGIVFNSQNELQAHSYRHMYTMNVSFFIFIHFSYQSFTSTIITSIIFLFSQFQNIFNCHLCGMGFYTEADRTMHYGIIHHMVSTAFIYHNIHFLIISLFLFLQTPSFDCALCAESFFSTQQRDIHISRVHSLSSLQFKNIHTTVSKIK